MAKRKPGRPRKRGRGKIKIAAPSLPPPSSKSLCSRLEEAVARICMSVERLENL